MEKFDKVEEFLRKDAKKYGEVKGLRDAICRGLAGEEPIDVRDWTGPERVETKQILVVALTPTRVVIVSSGMPPYYGDDGAPHLDVTEWPLENQMIHEQWSKDHKTFLLSLVDRTTGKAYRFHAPNPIKYASDFRRAATKLRAEKEARFNRMWWVGIFSAGAAVVVALVALVALFWPR